MTRQQARTSKRKNEGRPCAFISKFNPRVPDICKIIRKQRSIIDNDERAKQILPEGAIRVSYKRSSNLKELLAPRTLLELGAYSRRLLCMHGQEMWLL